MRQIQVQKDNGEVKPKLNTRRTPSYFPAQNSVFWGRR